jgi:hypothetical protein
MTLGPTAFGALVWGAVVLVLAVFGYECYVLVREFRVGRARREDAHDSPGERG